MAEPNANPREQEQSIKARKKMLYEADEVAAVEEPTGPRRSFAEYVATTPAAPLPSGTRSLLWISGVVVVLLLAAALLTG